MLTDFGIRKSAYLNQQIQTVILMWMVVAITLSGVALAGVQLVAGYKLAAIGKAAFDQGGNLSIEHSKISIGSSVTGLMILAISLAFFTIFVYKVYFITDPGDAPATGSGLPALLTPPSPKALNPQSPTNLAVPYALPGSQPMRSVPAQSLGGPSMVGQHPSNSPVAQPRAGLGSPNAWVHPDSPPSQDTPVQNVSVPVTQAPQTPPF